MGYIEREKARVERALHEAEQYSPLWLQLYAVNQALGWVSDPQAYASPLIVVQKSNTPIPVPGQPDTGLLTG